MYKNKKLYLFFGLLTLTLCLTSFTHISYANDIDSGETEVGITFSKSPIKPKDPDPGIDEIPSGPSPSIPTNHNKFLPKTGEVINAFLVALGVGLSFLFFLFKMMNRRTNTQNTMEEII
jgi:LPXTG-motif cell wall-anchored protein